VPRVLSAIIALGFAFAVIASPATTDAKSKPKPADPFVPGIDVSYHQGSIDWSRVDPAHARASRTLTATPPRRTAPVRGHQVAGAYPTATRGPTRRTRRRFLRAAAVASGDLVGAGSRGVNSLDASALTTWAQTGCERRAYQG
jgi:hypothetical protein